MSCVRASDALAHSILLESRIGKDYSCHPPTSCPVYNIPFFFFNCMRLHQTVQHLTATYHFFLVCPALVVLTPFTVFGLSSTIRPPFVRIMPPPPFFFLSTRTPSEVTHFNVPSSLSLYYSHFFPPQCNNDNKANGEKGRRGTAAKLGHPFTSVYCFACAGRSPKVFHFHTMRRLCLDVHAANALKGPTVSGYQVNFSNNELVTIRHVAKSRAFCVGKRKINKVVI